MPSASEEDKVYVIVKEQINGQTQRYIGVFEPREFGDLSNYIGVDFYKQYNSPESSVLEGLEYLEGKTVSVIIDDVPSSTTYVVSGGEIDIGTTGHTKVIVGLNFTSTLAPMYLNVETRGGTTRGSQKSVQTTHIRFKDTYEAKVGQTKETVEKVNFGSDDTLFSGDAEAWLDNGSEYLKLIYVINDSPTPCSVLAMINEVEGEGG